MEINVRESIVATATEIVDEGGAKALTMRRLGDRLGLSRTAMYRYFAHKESLLAEIVRRGFARFVKPLEDAARSPSIDAVVGVARMMYEFGIRKPELYRLMFVDEWDRNRYPEVYDAAITVFRSYRRLVAAQLAEAQGPSSGAMEITATSFAFVHGLVLLRASGHRDAEKGLDDPIGLIAAHFSSVFG